MKKCKTTGRPTVLQETVQKIKASFERVPKILFTRSSCFHKSVCASQFAQINCIKKSPDKLGQAWSKIIIICSGVFDALTTNSLSWPVAVFCLHRVSNVEKKIRTKKNFVFQHNFWSLWNITGRPDRQTYSYSVGTEVEIIRTNGRMNDNWYVWKESDVNFGMCKFRKTLNRRRLPVETTEVTSSHVVQRLTRWLSGALEQHLSAPGQARGRTQPQPQPVCDQVTGPDYRLDSSPHRCKPKPVLAGEHLARGPGGQWSFSGSAVAADVWLIS